MSDVSHELHVPHNLHFCLIVIRLSLWEHDFLRKRFLILTCLFLQNFEDIDMGQMRLNLLKEPKDYELIGHQQQSYQEEKLHWWEPKEL